MLMDILNKCINPISVPKVTGTTLRILRCGKCVNCIKQKKNELAVRTFREFEGQPIGFLTFTYRDEDCPIQVTHIDNEGNFVSDIVRGRDSDFFSKAKFVWKRNKDGKPSKRYQPTVEMDDSGMHVQYYTTFYQDLKNALKRFRIKHPRTLKQFIAVPEYGSLTYRPHYHMLILGFDDKLLQDLAKEWPYGDVYVDNCKDENKPNDPERISKYVAKYCVKGKFDCPYIKKNYCRKPRRSVSIGYGLGRDFEHLKQVHMCTSELGITSPWEDIELSERQLSLLASRRAYFMNGKPMPLPKYLVTKMFKRSVKVLQYKAITYDNIFPHKPQEVDVVRRFFLPLSDSDKEEVNRIKSGCRLSKTPLHVSYHTESSPLQNKVANFILARLVHDAGEQLQKDLRNITDISDLEQKTLFAELGTKDISERLEKEYYRELEYSSIY